MIYLKVGELTDGAEQFSCFCKPKAENVLNSKTILKMLQDDGWEIVRTRGSHHQLRHKTKTGLVTLPHPKKDLPPGTVKSILKQAGLA